MSSIAITGGATGTGVFSLLAPSTSTNRTLTLPDATDTMVGIAATQTLTNKTLTNVILDGTVTIPLSYVRLNTANGYGSTNTAIRRFTNVVNNVGTDITYADSATLGASFTINTAGVYSVSYVDNFGSVSNIGITINSTQLSTDIGAVSVADRLAISTSPNVNHSVSTSSIFYAAAASIVRAHTDGSATGLAGRQHFTIARVA